MPTAKQFQAKYQIYNIISKMQGKTTVANSVEHIYFLVLDVAFNYGRSSRNTGAYAPTFHARLHTQNLFYIHRFPQSTNAVNRHLSKC